MIRYLFAPALAAAVFCFPFPSSFASPGEGSESSPEPQKSGSILLPVWEEGEHYESFDIRIWPEEVVIWLERENLRDLIADPETPEEEKKSLKQVLALQKAWSAT